MGVVKYYLYTRTLLYGTEKWSMSKQKDNRGGYLDVQKNKWYLMNTQTIKNKCSRDIGNKKTADEINTKETNEIHRQFKNT